MEHKLERMNAKLVPLVLCCLLEISKPVVFAFTATHEENMRSIQKSVTSPPPKGFMECDAFISTCRSRFLQQCGDPGDECHCDKLCLVYNDCCEDFTDLCVDTHTEGLAQYGHLMGRNIVCHRNPMSKFVADCPALSPSQHRDACLEGASSLRLDRPPVTDSKTSISFLNEHCALCNGAAEDDLISWTLSLFGLKDSQSLSEFLPSIQNILSSGSQGIAGGAEWEWYPKRESGRRQCIPEVIDTCPNKEHPLTALCSNSTSYVSGVDPKMGVFQNRHCLLCHGQTYCRLPSPTGSNSRNTKLSMLMDFQLAGRSQVHMISAGYESPWEELTCELLDGQLEKCEVKTCKRGLDLVNGSCMSDTQLVRLALNVTFFPRLEQPQQSVNQSSVLSEINHVDDVNFTDAAHTSSWNVSSLSAKTEFTFSRPSWMASGDDVTPLAALNTDKQNWALILALAQQAALGAFPSSLLVNGTVISHPEQPNSALVTVNLLSKVYSASPYLIPTLNSLQSPLITFLQSKGFLGNVTLCLNDDPDVPSSDSCKTFLLVEVPENPESALGEETNTTSERKRNTFLSAHSGAWLLSVPGLGLVLTSVLAVSSFYSI